MIKPILSFAAGMVLVSSVGWAQCTYMGGYPWRSGGCLIAEDLNAAIDGRNPLLNVPAKQHHFITGFNSGVPLFGQPSFADLTGTLSPNQIPPPGPNSLGGVFSYVAPGGQFVYGITPEGKPISRVVTYGDLGGGSLPPPSSTTLGGVKSSTAPANNFSTGVDATGAMTYARPTMANLGGVLSPTQVPLPTTTTLGGVKSSDAVVDQYVTNIDATGTVTRAPALTESSGALTFTDASGAGLTITQSGKYNRYGGMVFAYAKFTYPTTSNSANAALAGLPVPVISEQGRQCAVTMTDNTNLAYVLPGAIGSTQLLLYNSVGAQITNAQMSGKVAYVMCTYPAV